MWMQTMLRAIPQYREIVLERLSRPTLVILQTKGDENYYGSPLNFFSKRAVHFESGVNKELDKKQREILQKYEITHCKRDSRIWEIHPTTIEHHALVLKEGGFMKLTESHIINYYKITKKKIRLLKLHNCINSQTSVVGSFMHHLENPPLKKLELKSPDERENSFISIHNAVLMSYLIWRLETSASEIDRILKTYPRIRHKSFKYMMWALNILEHDLGFTKEKILRHGYLIHSSPHNILDTLQCVPVLCGKDVTEIFHKHPKVIMTNTNTLLATAQHLKDHGIPDSYVHRRLDVFTLASDSVIQRLRQMSTVPELRPYAVNPRMVEIVHYQPKVSARIEHLQNLQRQCASLHILIGRQASFDSFASKGMDRSTGTDLAIFLAHSLKTQVPEVRNYLSKHPFWNSVSCISAQTTLDLLLKKKFEEGDILSNLHLVLYPSDEVEKILDEMPTSEALKSAQNIYRMTNNGKEPAVTKRTELALCLYFLEKKHHFTGNGIWKGTLPQ